ncbi:MAG: 50S ribosomal protein L11 methyltransferase [Firmicutes bacterium]|nr:50S ribosomal protein L11 methyltransferase [Bacillota bacterium]MBQ2304484.1 50S ribosomal protein L11 methyltransferase [Bacillota bacterium]
MRYLELVIHTTEEGLEPVEAELMAMGYTDLVVNDPRDFQDLMNKKHEYDWDYLSEDVMGLGEQEPTVTVYLEGEETGNGYFQAQKIDMMLEDLRQSLMNGDFGPDADFGGLTVTTALRDDGEWKDNWKEYFKPKKVSDHIIVCPLWEEYELSAEEREAGMKVLRIDPGMAFGTGTHETTSLCLKALEKYLKSGMSVLDVGTGSGILAIAAKLLGAGDIKAVDIDPEAVRSALENAETNCMAGDIDISYGDLTKGVDFKADIVVANLMADLVMMLSNDVRRHMKAGARFISSGIIDEKLEEVLDCLRSKGFEIEEVTEDGMWRAVTAG